MTSHDRSAPPTRAATRLPRRPLPQPWSWRRAWPGAAMLAAALALIPFDEALFAPLHRWLNALPLGRLYDLGTEWPNFGPIALIFVIVGVLDRRRAHLLATLAAALLVASTANETLKHLCGRGRPEAVLMMSHNDRRWLEDWAASHPRTRLRPEPRDQWLGLSPQRPWVSDRFASFPSGHANAACVMGLFLSRMYPPLRGVWGLLAAATMLARVASARHFPSDVLAGAGLGWLAAQWVFSWRRPPAWGLAIRRRAQRRRRNPQRGAER